MGKTLLIYHYEDNDGVGSAALYIYYMKHKFGMTKEDFELLPSNYNTLDNFFKRNDIEEYLSQFDACVMTDISSANAETMLMLKNMFGYNFVWVDHHKPVIDASKVNGFDSVKGLRDVRHSAFKNMWRYLYNISDSDKDEKCPPILKRLSGWDSFTFTTENLTKEECKVVNLAVTKTLKLNIDNFLNKMHLILRGIEEEKCSEMLSWLSQLRAKGEEDSAELDSINKVMCETVGDFNWTVSEDNHTACMVVTYGSTGSESFKSVKDIARHGIVMKRQKNGNWTVSLYNTDNGDTFHCGDYLRAKYNGGGHLGAAGCTLTEDQFIAVLKAKHI